MIYFFPLRPPADALLIDVAQRAAAAGNLLIHRGDGDVRISPICPPGWFRVGVSVKRAAALPNAGAMEVAA